MESVLGLVSAQQCRMPTEPVGQPTRADQVDADEAPEETFEATIIRLDHSAAEALFQRAWSLPF
jgi:hypothetical protein